MPTTPQRCSGTREQVGIAVAEYKKQQRHGKAKAGRKPRPAVLKAAVSLHLAARKLLKLHGGATQLGAAHAQALHVELAAVRAVLMRLETAT